MAAELQTLLVSLTKPDNAGLKDSTAKLQQFLKNNDQAPVLMLQQIAQSPQVEARQMAAILLRKELDGDMWKKMNETQQKECQNLLLERLVNEEVKAVRQAVASLVKAVAKQVEEWPELLAILERLIGGTASTALKETGVKLMRNLMGTRACVEKWRIFYQVFCNTLSDTTVNLETLVEAVRGVGSGAAYMDWDEPSQEVNNIPNITPAMLKVLQTCIEQNESMFTGSVIEVFNDMLGLNFPVFGKTSCEVAKFMLQVARMKDKVSHEIRAKALAFLGFCCRRKIKVLQRHSLINPIFQVCVEGLLEPDPEDEDENGDDDNSVHATAADALDTIFLNVPRQTFQQAITIIGKLSAENDTDKRFAGILLLMLMSEGCAEMIMLDEKVMKQLVEYCIKELKHPEPRVRTMACQCLVQFATHLEPPVLKYSKPILAGVVEMLKSGASYAKPNTDKVNSVAWQSLDVWVQEMKGQAAEVLPDLMGVLSDALNAGLSNEVKKNVLQVLGTLAASVETGFIQYYRPVMQTLSAFVAPNVLDGKEKEDEFQELVGAAWIAMGNVMVAVGMQNNEMDHVNKAVESVLKLMTLEHSPRKDGFIFICTIASLYKNDLVKMSFFMPIMNMLYSSLEGDDGVEILEEDENLGPSAGQFGFEENKTIALDSMEALANVGPACRMQIKSVILEERTSALSAARTLSENVNMTNDKLQEIYLRAMLFFDYPHPAVRLSVTEVLNEVLNNCIRQHPSPMWKRGETSQINPEVMQFLQEIPWLWLASLEEDDDPNHAALILDHLNALMLKLGPSFCALKNDKLIMIDRIYEFVDLALDEKLFCQQEDEEIRGEDEIEDNHKAVVDSAMTILSTLAQIFGVKFESKFREFFPKLVKFCHMKRHNNFRAMAIGCLGDVIQYFCEDEKEKNTNVTKQYLSPSFEQALAIAALEGDEYCQMRQNSIFCLGTLFQAGGVDAKPFVEAFLKVCIPLLSLPRGSTKSNVAFIRDNAISALSKLVVACGPALDEKILKELAPRIVDGLPLEKDFIENKFVYPVLCQIYKANTTLLPAPALEKARNILRAVVAEGEEIKAQLDETVRKQVKEFLQANSLTL